MNRINRLYNMNRVHKKGYTGRGVTVAVLDTGIFSHRDFDNRIIDFIDCVGQKNTPYDDNSHGTHISGIIAGSGLSSRGMYRGMAPLSNIVSIKVLEKSGTGNKNKIIRGCDWVLKNHKEYAIRVVNISIGTEITTCKDSTDDLIMAVNELWDAGLFVIVSAGNNGPDYHTITTPGVSEKVITVGTNDIMTFNTTAGKSHRIYSGKGPTPCNIKKPDILAPGNHIISCSNVQGRYTAKSGTSMSTPIVSGAAALILSVYPQMSNEEFKILLCQTAMDLGMDYNSQGCGLLNPYLLFR